MANPVCLVTGVGPGTGASMCRRFSEGGYDVAMLARNADRLEELEKEIPRSRAYPCNVAEEESVKETVARIKAEMGAPEVVIHNAVRGVRGNFLELKPKDLEVNFKVNVMGLLYLGQATAPDMIEKGKGAIVVTGNTSAWRGKGFFAGTAPTKAAQRILAQSMARTLGEQGVHVSFIVIDAVIDVPWTREAFADKPDDFFIQPSAIADQAWHLAHQDPSCWTFEIDVRPFKEVW